MASLEEKLALEQQNSLETDVGAEIMRAGVDEIVNRTRLLENEIKVCLFLLSIKSIISN